MYCKIVHSIDVDDDETRSHGYKPQPSRSSRLSPTVETVDRFEAIDITNEHRLCCWHPITAMSHHEFEFIIFVLRMFMAIRARLSSWARPSDLVAIEISGDTCSSGHRIAGQTRPSDFVKQNRIASEFRYHTFCWGLIKSTLSCIAEVRSAPIQFVKA